MRKYFDKWTVALLLLALLIAGGAKRETVAGIIQAIVPAAVPTANKTGNSSKFQLGSGTPTSGHCAEFDANGNIIDSGVLGCTGAGGGGTLFSNITSGTNTSGATMTVGNTSTLDFTGTGVVNANQVSSTTVPTNAAADQVLQTTASATGAWKSVPDCDDSGGNHLNYDTTAHTWSCGTSSTTVAVPYVVQSKSVRGTSITLDFASVATDNLVVCAGWFGGAGTDASLADGVGTTYTRRVQVTGQTNNNIAIFTATVPSSPGTLVITGTFPAGAGFQGISAIEFSPFTMTFDTSTSSTAGLLLSLTTAAANEIVVNCVDGSSNGGVTSFRAGYTGVSSNGSDSGGIGYMFVSTAGQVAASLANTSTFVTSAAIAVKTQ